MSGQDGNRGYYYQAVVSILNACTSEGWEKICVEYSTNDDKVDIALLSDKEHVLNAIQVKSSINQFSVTSIKMWLSEITNDTKADVYELILIGSCEKTANTFIKSIEKYYQNNMDKESNGSLKGYTDFLNGKNIKITVLPFDAENLFGIIRDSLNKFLSSLSYLITYPALDQLAHALVSLQMFLATNGRNITRDEYKEKIEKWLITSSNGQISKPTNYSSLVIKSFDFTSMSLSDSFIPIKIIESPPFLALRNKYIRIGSDLIDAIFKIVIEKASENIEKKGKNNTVNTEQLKKYIDDISVLKKIEKSALATQVTSVSAELSEKEKTDTSMSIEKYWNISVDHSFFCVGALTKNTSFTKLYGSATNYSGSEAEKKKNYLIQDLLETILNLDTLELFGNIFHNLCYVPLCINNNGKESDANITVSINISNSGINPFIFKNDLSSDEMELLGAISDWFVDEDIIPKIFGASDNGVVRENNMNTFASHAVPLSPPNIFGKRKTYDIGDFMIRFFDYQAKPDMYGNISYDIPSLRVAESKWMSPFLFFMPKGSESNIEYTILSENLNEKTVGTLELELPEL